CAEQADRLGGGGQDRDVLVQAQQAAGEALDIVAQDAVSRQGRQRGGGLGCGDLGDPRDEGNVPGPRQPRQLCLRQSAGRLGQLGVELDVAPVEVVDDVLELVPDIADRLGHQLDLDLDRPEGLLDLVELCPEGAAEPARVRCDLDGDLTYNNARSRHVSLQM